MTSLHSRARFRRAGVRFSSLLPAAMLLFSGCASLALQSTWTLSGGDDGSWRGGLSPLGDRDSYISIRNDDMFLHVAFTTTDPALQDRILKQGIFFWFDQTGGEGRRFGIRYPVAWGTMPASMDAAPRTGETESGFPIAGYGKPGDDVEIYTDGYKEYERLGKKDAGGIDVRVARLSDTLLCQVKIPLRGRARGPYALGAGPGDMIGVGIETRANLTSIESLDSILPFQAWRQVRLASR